MGTSIPSLEYLFGYSNFIGGEIAERLLFLFKGYFGLIPNFIDTDYNTNLWK